MGTNRNRKGLEEEKTKSKEMEWRRTLGTRKVSSKGKNGQVDSGQVSVEKWRH